MMKSTVAGILIGGWLGAAAEVIPVSDPRVVAGLSPYHWVHAEGVIASAVSGASLNLAFTGTRNVTLKVDTAHLAGRAPTRGPVLAWTVNGGAEQIHQLTAGEHSITLATDLDEPVIDLYIKGMSPFEDRWNGALPANSARITGIDVDPGARPVAAKMPDKIWLNIGDSIMSGDAAALATDQGRPGDHHWAPASSSRASYGYLLAKHFGFREARLAFGGYNWGGGMAGVPALDLLIDQQTSTASRLTDGLLAPAPAVVLVNLGENGVPADHQVVNGLAKLRARAGKDAMILVMAPVSHRGEAEIKRACDRYLSDSKDPNTRFLALADLKLETADGQHPNAAGHLTVFHAAKPLIAAALAADAGAHLPKLLGDPWWQSTTMRNEPVLFIGETDQHAPTGKLLFVPTANLLIRSPDLKTEYQRDRDYTWTPGSAVIELTPDSRIPFKTTAQMFPPPGSPNTHGGVLFSEGGFFHDLQVQVSYTHAGHHPWQPPAVTRRLARTQSRLQSHKPFTLVALGDSITEGYNASGFPKVDRPPHQPPFPALVAAELNHRFPAPVTLVNLAVAGTTANWGISQIPKLAEHQPDLVILAFGMNHTDPPAAFAATIRRLLDALHAAAPQADVILVAPMAGNPRIFPEARFTEYRDALAQLQAPNILLADVTTPWLELTKTKPFSDLSGNHVNHPNDFAHRLYAHLISRLLTPTAP